MYPSDADGGMAGGITIVVDGGTLGVVLGVEGSRDNDAGGVLSSSFVKCRRRKWWDCRDSTVGPRSRLSF